MATKLVQARLDERIVKLIDPARKRVILEQALVGFLKLDPVTLKPLTAGTKSNAPKKYADCTTNEERIAYQEDRGYIWGGKPGFPDVWLTPNGTLWHYDPDVSHAANAEDGRRNTAIGLAEMAQTRAKSDGKLPISQDRWDSYVAAADGDEDALNLLERKYTVVAD